MKQHKIFLVQERNQTKNSGDSGKLVDERKVLKNKIDGTGSERLKEKLKVQYRDKDKKLKKSMKKGKKQWFEYLAIEAEIAGSQGNIQTIYNITKTLLSDRPKQKEHIKDEDETLLTRENGIKMIW